jgi:hypothetical protein
MDVRTNGLTEANVPLIMLLVNVVRQIKYICARCYLEDRENKTDVLQLKDNRDRACCALRS